MYSDTLLDHFQSPRNVGDMDAPDAEGVAENPVCGDQLRIQLRISKGAVTAVQWRATGCPPVIAAASATSELLMGMPVKAVRELDRLAIEQAVGGLPARKAHAALLVVDTLQRALADP